LWLGFAAQQEAAIHDVFLLMHLRAPTLDNHSCAGKRPASCTNVLLPIPLHTAAACRLDMLRDIASGMVFLHSRKPPIVHGDLRSPNLVRVSHSLSAAAPVHA
jgi:hypothetical protein